MKGRLNALLRSFAGPGRVVWIGVRPGRLCDMRDVDAAWLCASGLENDHAREGRRAVTLIQSEHLPVIAALAGRTEVTPGLLRRNIVVSGVNLNALRNAPVDLGAACIEITGPCAPCSRMEDALGPGGYTAMRGHGGWCARVLRDGQIRLGSAVMQTG
ncbi:MAG: MOSC domain-containing protein [Pseudomonadota bacterium]